MIRIVDTSTHACVCPYKLDTCIDQMTNAAVIVLPIASAAGARNAMRAAEGSGLIVIRQMHLNFLFRNLIYPRIIWV